MAGIFDTGIFDSGIFDTPIVSVNVDLVGQEAQYQTGTLTIPFLVKLPSLTMQANTGRFGLIYWADINDNQTSDWQPVDDSAENSWTDVNDAQAANWN